MKIDFDLARRILLEEVAEADQFELTGQWVDITRDLADAAEKSAKTMIAMLGTAMLAKATDVKVDVFSLMVGDDASGRSYSARALCKEVLAADATKLGIHLGVTGREPLNNQPFFGKQRVTKDLPVHANSKAAFDLLFSALSKLDKVKKSEEARLALRSFLSVRKKAKPKIIVRTDSVHTSEELAKLLETFIATKGENGKRAQAVVAGILDCFYTPEQIRVSRINDPSRSYPGDVGVVGEGKASKVERSFEVRDKPVTTADLRNLTTRALEKNLGKIGMVALSKDQKSFDASPEIIWASRRNVRLGVFFGLRGLLEVALFWTKRDGIVSGEVLKRIYERSVQLEVSEAGLVSLAKL